MGNGQIEAKQPDGTVIPVPGIRLNKDGKSYTIMVDGKEVTIDVNDVTITDENGVQVKGYQNVDGDDEYEEILTYTLDDLKGKSPEEIVKLAPATSPEGYTRGSISTLEGKENLVKYYDPNTKEMVGVYDLTTGEFETPDSAGIFEVKLKNGKLWEMLHYDTAQDSVNAMSTMGAHGTTMDFEKLPESYDFFMNSLFQIEGIKAIGGMPVSNAHKNDISFGVALYTLNVNETLLVFINGKGKLQANHCSEDAEEIYRQIKNKTLTAPVN